MTMQVVHVPAALRSKGARCQPNSCWRWDGQGHPFFRAVHPGSDIPPFGCAVPTHFQQWRVLNPSAMLLHGLLHLFLGKCQWLHEAAHYLIAQGNRMGTNAQLYWMGARTGSCPKTIQIVPREKYRMSHWVCIGRRRCTGPSL